MFGSRAMKFRTPLRCLRQLRVNDVRQRLDPDDLFLVGQILLKGRVDAKQADRTTRLNVRSSRGGLAGEKMQQALLANHLAGASECDGLLIGTNFDLATQDQPAGADTVAPTADNFVRKEFCDGPELSARDRAAYQCRFRAMLREEPVELPVNFLGKAHVPVP